MVDQYEVLSPWAQADARPARGIAPRVPGLAGKTIGLYASRKRASRPILAVVESELKARYQDLATSWWIARSDYLVTQVETEHEAEFRKWVSSVDAVVAAIGD